MKWGRTEKDVEQILTIYNKQHAQIEDSLRTVLRWNHTMFMHFSLFIFNPSLIFYSKGIFTSWDWKVCQYFQLQINKKMW